MSLRNGKPPSFASRGPFAALIAAVTGGAASGCADPPPPPPPPQEVYGVCVDRQTFERVDDDRCPAGWVEDDDDNDRFFAYFYPSNGHGYVHPVGHKVSGGSYRKPPGVTITVKAPTTGTTTTTKTGIIGNTGPGAKPGGGGGFGTSGGSSGS